MYSFLPSSKAMNPKHLLASLIFLLISIIILIPINNLNCFFSDHLSIEHNSSISKYDEELIEVIPIVDAVGPESIAFDPVTGDGPYTGVSDGRIIKWDQSERRWLNFAVTTPMRDGCDGSDNHDLREDICGRPLGLHFNEKTRDLYIADAYMGLQVVGPNGSLATKVATQAHDTPFIFTNSLDIDQSTGVVYFTDSSTIYQRRNYISVITSGDETGRMLKYDPTSKETTVMINNLSFPNGVALSKNGEFLLVAETTKCRILKIWLDPPEKYGSIEEFAQVPGFPDNIKMNHKRELWVAIHSKKTTILKLLLSYSWIGKALNKLPFNITKVSSYITNFRRHGIAVRLSEDGEILEILEDKYGSKWRFASEVHERNGYLWIGSVKMPFLVKQKI